MPKVDRNRPATLADVARDLGLSKVAISKALKGHTDISEATRARVIARARELHYQPNTVALSLRSHKTRLIGIVAPTLMHSFFAEMIEGISIVLGRLDYQPIVIVTGEQEAQEVRQIEAVVSNQVEGFVIVSCQQTDAHGIFKRLQDRGVPFVLAGRRIRNLDACFVGVDNFEIGRMAGLHLFSRGRRRIAHLRGPAHMTAILRCKGFEAAARESGLELPPGFIAGGSDNDDVVARATAALLKKRRRPDAIFCYNDPVAIAAIRAIHLAGLRVPQDVAVAGVGNIRNLDLLVVPLTTIDQRPRQMGERAAELLLSQLDGRRRNARREVILPARLVIRASSGSARKALIS